MECLILLDLGVGY